MKLLKLLSIPVGFAIVKSITKRIDDQPKVTPKKVVPEGFTLGPAAGKQDFNIIGESFALVESLQPKSTVTGAVARPIAPLVPDFSKVETAIGKLDFTGFDASKFPKIGDISSLDFQTGLFDPAVQERLKSFKPGMK